jgi:hypothetical protein
VLVALDETQKLCDASSVFSQPISAAPEVYDVRTDLPRNRSNLCVLFRQEFRARGRQVQKLEYSRQLRFSDI